MLVFFFFFLDKLLTMKQIIFLLIAGMLSVHTYASTNPVRDVQKNIKKVQETQHSTSKEPVITCGIGTSSITGTCWQLTVTVVHCCICEQAEANIAAMLAARNEVKNIIRNHMELLEMLEAICD